jgi:hypothetical protein
MKNDLITVSLENASVRRTSDGRISLFDALKLAGVKKPRDMYARWLTGDYSEVVQRLDSFQFSGKGQQKTPVVNARQWRKILAVLPTEAGRDYREASAELVTAWLENPALIAAAAIDRITDPAELSRLETRAKSKKSAIGLSGTILSAGASKKALSRIHDINNVAVTGRTAEENKAETGLRLHRDGMTEPELAAMHLIQTLEIQVTTDRKLEGDGAVIGGSLEVVGDVSPVLKKYLGDRKQPHGGLIQVTQ